jgi:hypothetical protein
MAVDLVAASPAHVGRIATRMREADVIECRAMGLTPKEALRAGLRASSLCYTARVDGRPEAMFGLVVTNALCGEGAPWMLGTDAIYEHPREMIRRARPILAAFVDSTKYQSNVVAKDNTRAIRFIRWLGFNVREGVIVFAGTEFLAFDMDRS